MKSNSSLSLGLQVHVLISNQLQMFICKSHSWLKSHTKPSGSLLNSGLKGNQQHKESIHCPMVALLGRKIKGGRGIGVSYGTSGTRTLGKGNTPCKAAGAGALGGVHRGWSLQLGELREATGARPCRHPVATVRLAFPMRDGNHGGLMWT